MWLIFMIVAKGIKIIISNTTVEQKIIIASCMIGIIGIMLHGMVDTIFFRPQVNIIFWMIIAVFAANINLNKIAK